MKSVKELSRRYGVTEQALRKFIRNNLGEINSDGEHLRKTNDGWKLDDEGLKRLDKLRGYATVDVEVVSPPNEVVMLKEENARLMKMLLTAQGEIIRLQTELLRLKPQAAEPKSEPKPKPQSSPPESIGSWLAKKFRRYWRGF